MYIGVVYIHLIWCAGDSIFMRPELRRNCFLYLRLLTQPNYYDLASRCLAVKGLPYLSFLVPVKNEFVTTISPAVHL